MTFSRWPPLPAAILLLALAGTAAAAEELQEVVISATLRDTALAALPNSVSVLSADTLRQSGVQHLGDVLGQVPNLTAAGGTSRPRYFQIRGIGEQEQYQGAPNPSVGFLIDDIDFSGVGMPATLIDLRQIEVLRGPQGSAYGANALAGLISVRSREPGDAPDLHVESTLGDFGVRGAGIVAGNGFGAGNGGWRVVAQRFVGDGFRRNAFLGRSDTNGFDETTLRARARWRAGAALNIDLIAMQVDLDNGYDAWSIDNSRITQSDRPGRDAQLSRGAALRVTQEGLPFGQLRSVTTVADSAIEFSFDGDWGNDAFWARQSDCLPDPTLCVPYDFASRTLRQRHTVAEDLRLLGNGIGSGNWLLGAYLLRLSEDNQQLDRYNGAVFRQLDSAFRATTTALYGQLEQPLAAATLLTLGLRGEQRRAHYDDSDGTRATPVDRMLGGNASLSVALHPRSRIYLTLARGYKAGGFNIGTALPPERREFQPEYLWSVESGWKYTAAADSLHLQLAAFAMRRQDQQVATSLQVDPSDPLSYQFFTDNAARGDNRGVEATFDWTGARWRIDGTLGLLAARYRDFRYRVVGYDASGSPQIEWRDLSGRDQEYAPRSKASLGVVRQLPGGYFVRIDAAHTAGYYFSASHDQRAFAHTLVNARLGWRRGAWSASAWVRNLFDEEYALHGFYFGNEPPAFAERLYLQPGDPRQWGVTLAYDLRPN